jgi:alpha-amylase
MKINKFFNPLRIITIGLILASCSVPESSEISESYKIDLERDQRVLMQGFYWDCFNESGDGMWWEFMRPKIHELAAAGFTEIWLPPSQKSHHNPSMGYDPYDFYDLGEFMQKTTDGKTYFGSRQELETLIKTIHENGMKVYADLVYNHVRGGKLEFNPNTGTETYTLFEPLSGKYSFSYNDFHPSTYQASDSGVWADFPDICHSNPNTMKVIEDYTRWLKDSIGYDGWRYDWVNGYYPWVIKDLQTKVGGFGVVELWTEDKNEILEYVRGIDFMASAFDFPLFFALRDLCNDKNGGYDMKKLWEAGISHDLSENAVTFVQNHDTDKETEYQINHDKMMAYAHILTHEALPTVFWKDYYNYGLARKGKPDGIDQLLWVRKNLAYGKSSLLHANENLYIMQRHGSQDNDSSGLILLLNNHPENTQTIEIETKWKGALLKAYAWGSSVDDSIPLCVETNEEGITSISVAPRGYVIYAPHHVGLGFFECE